MSSLSPLFARACSPPRVSASPAPASVHAPRSTQFQSFSTTCKCVIGSGFMALPYAFSQAGWLTGALCLAFMGARSYYTMCHILNCVHLTRSRLRRQLLQSLGGKLSYGSTALAIDVPGEAHSTIQFDAASMADPDFEQISYQQIASVLWGGWGRRLVDFVLIFAQMGCGLCFLSLVLTNLQDVCRSYGVDASLLQVSLPLFPLLLALSMPRSTTYLAGASHMGNLALLVAVATIIWCAAVNPAADLSFSALRSLPAFRSLHGVMLFFGISAFSFTAHAEIVSVEADAESRSVYAQVLPAAMSAIVAIYMSVSLFAYASFESATQTNILQNLGDALLVNLVRLSLSGTLLISYCLATFPASQALDLVFLGTAPVSELPHQKEEEASNEQWAAPEVAPLLTPHAQPASSPSGLTSPALVSGPSRLFRPTSSLGLSRDAVKERNAELAAYHWKGNLLRTGMVLFTFVVAVGVQNLGLLFSVVGAVFGGTLCYTLPPVFWLGLCRLEQIPLSRWRRLLLCGEVALGGALITVGVTVFVQTARTQGLQ